MEEIENMAFWFLVVGFGFLACGLFNLGNLVGGFLEINGEMDLIFCGLNFFFLGLSEE